MVDVKILSVMKLRLARVDKDRIRVTVFIGSDEDHYQMAGELVLDVGEWQTIGCALSMGLDRMIQHAPEGTYIPMKVTVEGQMKALGREKELLDSGRADVSVLP